MNWENEMVINYDMGWILGFEELVNWFVIFDVLVQYSWGVDCVDVGIFKFCYWFDVEVNYGFFVGNVYEFCEGLLIGIKGFKLI